MGKKKSQKSQAPAVPKAPAPAPKPPAPKAPETKPKIPAAPAPKPPAPKSVAPPPKAVVPSPAPAPAPSPAPAPVQKPPPFKKANIPRAVREQIWLRQFGKVYEGKCPTPWCQNVITVHDFQSGHNIPESKGGPTTAENLLPLCGRCNQSMGNQYTFDEWCLLGKEPAQASSPTPPSPASTTIKKPWYCWCFRI